MPTLRSAPAGAQASWLTSSDGYHVVAWYWPPRVNNSGSKVPAVILLHMFKQDKSSWEPIAKTLLSEGYAVIAIDLRGHGETLAPDLRPLAATDLEDTDFAGMLKDVAAAHAFLEQQQGVDSDRVAIIGASIGANLGLLYASNDRRVRTVVAMSPGLDYHGLQPATALLGLDRRPLFLIASEGDKYSADTCRTLQEQAMEDAPISLRIFKGKAHGTDLLAAEAGLDQTIVSGWLLNYLPPTAPPVT